MRMLVVWWVVFAAVPVWACGRPHVDVIVPFPAGGSMDAFARLLTDQAGALTGKPFVVHHVGGASGAIGARKAARSQPDGCTILLGNLGSVVLAHRPPASAGYHPSDLVPVIGLGSAKMLLVASPSLGIRSPDDLAFAARRLGRALHAGHPGVETVQHRGIVAIEEASGTRTVRVPYRGSGPLLNDLVAGHLDLAVLASPVALPLIDSGKLVLLADLAVWLRRQGREPSRSWAGVFVAKGTGHAEVQWLQGVFSRVLARPALHTAVQAMGIEPPDDDDPEAFSGQVADDVQRWALAAPAQSGR